MAADIPVEEAKTQLLSIQKSSPQNIKCIDCAAPSPTWASPMYGSTPPKHIPFFLMRVVFICLQCSGVHRSLGVHISFVRSITMDGWSNEQLTHMAKGGNARAREFFENKFGTAFKTMTIPEKVHPFPKGKIYVVV